MKPLFITGCLAIAGCADMMSKAEYDAEKKNQAETMQALRDDASAARKDYEKTIADLKKLITERTSIDALIPKVGEAKEDILKQFEADQKRHEDARRLMMTILLQQERYFEQTAKPAVGKPDDAEGPATGIYKIKKELENHETRLANQKETVHKMQQNLAYQRTFEEWSYSLLLDYRKGVQKSMQNLQLKLDGLNSANPEERAKAEDAFELEFTAFEKNIELLYEQQKEKRKNVPPRPEEKND